MAKSQSLKQIKIPVSHYRDLTFIKKGRQYRDDTATQRRQIVGIDTETDNGNIFLIASSDGKFLDHPDITFENIAEFLLHYEDYLIFFYNLGYDADCIIKLLPKEVLKRYKIDKELKFSYQKYNIHYIPKKRLTIKKGKHVASCYDIAQYYDTKSLSEAYEIHIKKPLDQEYLEMKDQRKFFTIRQYNRNKKQIRSYCIRDCLCTKELSEHWLDIFQKAFDFLPRKYISSGYLAEKVVIYNDIYIPRFNEIPYDIQELAWRSFCGGRFELIQRGFIGECYLYDINSAYPYALTFLPDITDGKWFESKKINPKSALGFFHIRANISDSVKIAPFPFRTKKNRIIYPTGEFETFVTLEELKAVQGDTRIKYKILDSYQFIANPNCIYPFRDFIQKQYDKRVQLKKEKNPLEQAIKIILNSIYGKTAQRVNNKIGNLFCPVIASFITGFARAQLYRFMRENNLENNIVAFATDSIACTRKTLHPTSEKLGEMKLDKNGNDVFFLSNGFYMFNGKWKNRGIGYDTERKIEIEHMDTRIDKQGHLYIAIKTTRTTHLKSGISYDKIQDIGKIEEYEKKINLNSDMKRFWLSRLESLNDKIHCNSMPLNINHFDEKLLDKLADTDYDSEYHPESEL